MLIRENDIERRLNNPLNLINQMKSGLSNTRKNAMSLFIPPSVDNDVNSIKVINPYKKTEEKTPDFAGTSQTPAQQSSDSLKESIQESTNPTSEDLIGDVDSRINLATAHDNAIKLLNDSITHLNDNIGSVKKDKLPSVIAAASKVITEIRKERLERDKNNKDINVHHHFYCPEPRKIESYEVIEVESVAS
ncbi:MAG: hypothetical protein ACRD9Q_00140 [Nitrososphaeraceae archaeon]